MQEGVVTSGLLVFHTCAVIVSPRSLGNDRSIAIGHRVTKATTPSLEFALTSVFREPDSDRNREATLRNSRLSRRFSSTQIDAYCEKNVDWFLRVAKRSSDDDRLLFTQRQKKWLFDLSTCADLHDCLCPRGSCESSSTNHANSLLHLTRLRGERTRRSSFIDDQPEPTLRREYRQLSDTERQSFHDALNKLKAEQIDGTSKYDLLVKFYSPKYAPGSHFGPAFLPFHREMLKQLELALRTYDVNIAIPYWDSSLDDGLPNPADSILWTDEFLGNGNGFFIVLLMLLNDTVDNLETTSKSAFTCDADFQVQGAVGLWVGGHMKDIPTSPDDPVFYLHHSFVDYLWEEFRLMKQTRAERETQYPTEQNSCNSYHYANSTMLPFKLKNIDGLSNKYTDMFYVYDSRPTCSSSQPMCESEYLFCDATTSRCLSQVRLGGNCTGFEWADICYRGKCVHGVCQPASESTKGSKEECGCDCNCTEKRLEEERRKRLITSSLSPIVHGAAEDVKTDLQFTGDEEGAVPNEDREADWVWMTLTVLKGTINTSKRSEVKATVFAQGVNYNGEYQGNVVRSSRYPYYKGLVTVQVRNPAKNGGMTKVRFNVTDETGLSCDPFCKSSEPSGYEPCSGTITLSTNRARGDVIPYSSDFNEALRMHWSGDRRIPDYLMFLCELCTCPSCQLQSNLLFENGKTDVLGRDSMQPDSPNSATEGAGHQKHCTFQRYDSFLLVGYADAVKTGTSESECKQWCETWTRQGYGLCNSLMYWSDDGTCVLTSESRTTRPRLFVHSNRDPVTYFDRDCQ
ncbi:unnamed protein product [Soboliphyme baturini]|uniref:Apple domain-containing protein n=1 Tax=Soboliphyme baturini TaxID=241478 RepID=A0A183IH80_9BILA|nr:unnamed protein product [Soboliphyme baturini]